MIRDFLETAGTAEKHGTSADLEKLLSAFKDKFHHAMNDDFNTASALGFIFELIREANRFLDSKPSGQKAKDLVMKTKDLLADAGGVLNIFSRTPEEWYRSLMKVKKIELSEEALLQKIAERQEARKQKEWGTADAVRKELEAIGIILEDKKDGTTRWKVKAG
jgi:cysteinyl-tRNA synthetase